MYVPNVNTYGYCKLLGCLLLHKVVNQVFFCEDHGIILIPCSKVMVHCLHTVITATSFKFLSLCTST